MATMALADETWKECSIYEVHAAFLKAESYKLTVSQAGLDLIHKPDLANPLQNAQRMSLLYSFRAQILGEIPPDTRWHRVDSLRLGEHIGELRVIRSADWIDQHAAPADDRSLARVAAWRAKEMTEAPDRWEAPILWGHSERGPLTIIEGNNRLTALAHNQPSSAAPITIYVGLSDMPCYWHEGDPMWSLLYNLWRQ
jgi:hypothetical protein